MAETTWTGDTDGDWDTAGNWSNGVPGASDTAFIVSGSVDIDGSAPTVSSISRIVVGPKYTGSIGDSTTKLDIGATDLDYGGRGGSAYLQGTYTTVTVQDTSSGDSALNFYGSSDTIGTLRIVGGGGTINIDSTCNITTTIEQIGADGVTTVIADGTTIGGSCTLTVDSGTFTMNEAIPTITVFGGELESNITSTDTITLLEVYEGRVRFKPSGSCTITQLTMYGGTMYTTDSTATSFTITDCTLHEGATLNEQSGLRNIIFTNPVEMEGGVIKYDIGREITLA